MRNEIQNSSTFLAIEQAEIESFDRLIKSKIYEKPEKDIQSSGYVLHTLEASIWCLLTSNSFEEFILKAVNLGDETDTTETVTGGIAGLFMSLIVFRESRCNK